jgi:hypothetical protein
VVVRAIQTDPVVGDRLAAPRAAEPVLAHV